MSSDNIGGYLMRSQVCGISDDHTKRYVGVASNRPVSCLVVQRVGWMIA